MTDARDNSSLPLLLSITGAVIAVVAGGWFFLNKESATPTATSEAPIELIDEMNNGGSKAAGDVVAPDATESTPDVEAELRKARLAADAEILVIPASQSAFYYYRQVLKADPQHAVAIAELDATLARVEQDVRVQLAAEEYDDAYEIARLVAHYKPEHPLVVATQTTLDDYTEDLVGRAIQHAQDGEDGQATELLAAVETLPGRNPEYLDAVRNSIEEIRSVRLAAVQDRARRAQLADEQARQAWDASIRSAIEAGNLISPAGASARDLLAEKNAWAADREQLTDELLDAMLANTESLIADQRLNEAEALLNAMIELSGAADDYGDLKATLDNALREAASNRVVSLQELKVIKHVSPRYPRLALEQDKTGWVELYFTVTTSGETADILVRNSHPSAIFNKAAITAVKQWAFEPVVFRGQIVNQRAGARLVFQLE